jgi:tRNA modification GTPase
MPSETLVALLTPAGRAAVATILVSGSEVLEHLERHFHPAGPPRLAMRPLGRIVFGRWGSAGTGEEVVVCRRSEDQIEIHCHGGRAASRAILETLAGDGCRKIEWREWIRRSSEDRWAADVRIALADAPTERTATLLYAQANKLRDAFRAINMALAEDEAAGALRQVTLLLEWSRVGRHLVEPWRIVLAGAPNVGKSSLINALLGYQRAIVHATPGTTRDLVAAPTALAGWPVELIDTAGIRAEGEPLEMAGIELAQQQAAAADLVLVVLDRSRQLTADERKLIARWPHSMRVLNKCDLPAAGKNFDGIEVSALAGSGIAELVTAIVARLVPAEFPRSTPLPFLESHVELLERLRELLLKEDCAAAATTLKAFTAS